MFFSENIIDELEDSEVWVSSPVSVPAHEPDAAERAALRESRISSRTRSSLYHARRIEETAESMEFAKRTMCR